MLEMNRAFGVAGAARGVTPEADIVFGGFLGFEFVRGFGDQTFVGKRLGLGRADDDNVPEEWSVVPDPLDLGQSRFMYDDRPRPAVVDEVLIVLGEHPGIGRYRNGADLNGAEETIGELGRVRP